MLCSPLVNLCMLPKSLTWRLLVGLFDTSSRPQVWAFFSLPPALLNYKFFVMLIGALVLTLVGPSLGILLSMVILSSRENPRNNQPSLGALLRQSIVACLPLSQRWFGWVAFFENSMFTCSFLSLFIVTANLPSRSLLIQFFMSVLNT